MNDFECPSIIKYQEHTLWMVKGGCKYLNPSNGAREPKYKKHTTLFRFKAFNYLYTFGRKQKINVDILKLASAQIAYIASGYYTYPARHGLF